MPRTSGEIARFVGGTCAGDLGAHVRRIARLEEAGDGDLAFVHDARYLEAARASTASCLIVTESLVDRLGPMRVPVIAVPSAEAAINLILAAWRPVDDQPAPGRHPSAVIDPSAQVDPTARIGPHVVIGRDAVVGAGVVLEAGVVLKELVRIGAQCVLGAHVVVEARCVLGSRVRIKAGAVIGGDGFGFRVDAQRGGLARVAHLGTVEIHDDVEIGSGTTVDRAKFGSTVIGSGSKIDNLCQIGHNCQIGRNCLIAAMTGLSGSVTVEDGVVLGGRVGATDHIRIGRGARMGACSLAVSDIPAGETWSGMPARPHWQTLRVWGALPKLAEYLRRRPIRDEAAPGRGRREDASPNDA